MTMTTMDLEGWFAVPDGPAVWVGKVHACSGGDDAMFMLEPVWQLVYAPMVMQDRTNQASAQIGGLIRRLLPVLGFDALARMRIPRGRTALPLTGFPKAAQAEWRAMLEDAHAQMRKQKMGLI